MSVPHISICLPAYKAQQYIGATLDSIASQTFQDWELIVVEDGSQDSTEEILRTWAKNITQSITFHRHECNKGLSAARNTAISLAKSNFIALIDADDLWLPAHLASLVKIQNTTNCDWAFGGVSLFDSDSGTHLYDRTPPICTGKEIPLKLFNCTYNIQPSATLLRKCCVEAVGGFDASLRSVEDLDMWIKLFRRGYKLAYSGAVTCRYRQHAQAMTRNAIAIAEALALVQERNLDWEGIPLNASKKETAKTRLAAARMLLRNDPSRALLHMQKALYFRPIWPRLWIYMCVAQFLKLLKR